MGKPHTRLLPEFTHLWATFLSICSRRMFHDLACHSTAFIFLQCFLPNSYLFASYVGSHTLIPSQQLLYLGGGEKNPPTAVLYCEEHRTIWSVCPFHLSQSLFTWEFGNSFSRCLWSGRMRNSAGHWSEHKHRLGSSQNDECAVQSVHLLLRARSLSEQPERCVNF